MSNTASNSFQRYEEWKRTLGTRMHSAALDLHERGLFVIPLKPGSEEPFLNWKELQGTKPTVEQIEGWFAQEPEINIGIMAGALSGIVVLVRESGYYSLGSYCVSHRLTPMARTHKAEYYYYKHPGMIVQSKENLLPGVHLVGDGAFVVAPPSVDGSGADYEWCSGLDELPPNDMPEKLMNLVAHKGLLEDGRALGVTMEPHAMRTIRVLRALLLQPPTITSRHQAIGRSLSSRHQILNPSPSTGSGAGCWQEERCPRSSVIRG